MNFSLLWDGHDVFWRCPEQPEWLQLETIQFPNFRSRFDQVAPPAAQGFSPPFLSVFPEPGLVQVWTGLFVRTLADWSILVRAPANIPFTRGYIHFEGIVETDHWFGPLFTNIRLTRTNREIIFKRNKPLALVQPIPRIAYDETTLNQPGMIDSIGSFDDEVWRQYLKTVVAPSRDPNRRIGAYAIDARRRRKRGCPHLRAMTASADVE